MNANCTMLAEERIDLELFTLHLACHLCGSERVNAALEDEKLSFLYWKSRPLSHDSSNTDAASQVMLIDVSFDLTPRLQFRIGALLNQKDSSVVDSGGRCARYVQSDSFRVQDLATHFNSLSLLSTPASVLARTTARTFKEVDPSTTTTTSLIDPTEIQVYVPDLGQSATFRLKDDERGSESVVSGPLLRTMLQWVDGFPSTPAEEDVSEEQLKELEILLQSKRSQGPTKSMLNGRTKEEVGAASPIPPPEPVAEKKVVKRNRMHGYSLIQPKKKNTGKLKYAG